MLTGTVEKIKELLGNGLSNEVVATAVGVHPSYISQLMSEEGFRNDVVSRRSTSLTEVTHRDNSWNSLEDKMLEQLHQKIDSGMVYKVPDMLRIATLANNAKRRGTHPQDTIAPSQQVVMLNIPSMVINKFKKTIDGEVVEVTTAEGDQQTLVTMSSAELMRKLISTGQTGSKQYAKLLDHIPGSSKEEIS